MLYFYYVFFMEVSWKCSLCCLNNNNTILLSYSDIVYVLLCTCYFLHIYSTPNEWNGGSDHNISHQSINGSCQVFSNWSNGNILTQRKIVQRHVVYNLSVTWSYKHFSKSQQSNAVAKRAKLNFLYGCTDCTKTFGNSVSQ